MLRMMVFVDGSNLVGDFRRMNLQVDNYEAFFHHVVERALEVWKPCCFPKSAEPVRLLRINWYALAQLDKWNLDDSEALKTLREQFDNNRELKSQHMAAVGHSMPNKSEAEKLEAAWTACIAGARKWYESRKRLIDGFRRFYYSLRSQTDFIDVIECGHWRVMPLEQQVAEKNLDTRLAVDMVTLVESYDIALLLSGDADNIPSLDFLKARGRQVGVVEFLAGHPPESKSAHSSSRLKVAADFVAQIYETELEAKKLARRPQARPEDEGAGDAPAKPVANARAGS